MYTRMYDPSQASFVPFRVREARKNKPPAHGISQDLDIVRRICRHAQPHTQTCMLRVCCLFFDASAPVVWESVVGVHNLLGLIPGVTSSVNSTRKEISLSIGSSATVSSGGHFGFCRKLVKYLEIYHSKKLPSGFTYSVGDSGWAQLMRFAKSGVILPNLLQLTLNPRCATTSSQLFGWIRVFMSPSLTAVQMVPAPPTGGRSSIAISHFGASTLVAQLASKCPELHTLWIFPMAIETGSAGNEHAMTEFWEPTFYDRLPLLSLRHLACPANILAKDTIDVLRKFPKLERLEIYSGIGATGEVIRVDVGSVYFYSSSLPLRHFAFCHCDWTMAVRVLGLDMFSSLDSLVLDLNRPSKAGTAAVSDDYLLRGLIPRIIRQCPVLTSLDLKFDAELELHRLVDFSPLTSLRLRSLVLRGISRMANSLLQALVESLPVATRLELPDLKLEPGQLYYFTRMPNLQNLIVASFTFTEIPLGADVMPETSLNFKILESLQRAKISVDLAPLARHLLSFWPNLERVLWGPGSEIKDSTSTQVNLEFDQLDNIVMNALNTIISCYRVVP